MAAALADPSPLTAFNPFGIGPAASQATLDRLSSSHESRFAVDSKFASQQLTLDGPLLKLPAGEVRLAAGAEYWRHSFDADLDDHFRLNPQSDFTLELQNYQRKVTAGFLEAQIPIVGEANRVRGIERLDLSAAARYEHYSDFGNTLVPRIGLTLSPIEQLILRAAYSRSFRAPNAADLAFASSGAAIFDIPDAESPSGFSAALIPFGANPKLTEETAKTRSFGIDWRPLRLSNLNVNATYFTIDYKDRIESPGFPSSLQDPTFFGELIRTPSVEETAGACNVAQFYGNFSSVSGDCLTAPVAAIVDLRTRNVATLQTNGIDLTTRYAMETRSGRFDFGLNATYIFDFARRTSPQSAEVEAVNTLRNVIAFRSRGDVSWSRDPWSASAFLTYTDNYKDPGNSSEHRHIDSQTIIDLNISRTFLGESSPFGDVTANFNVQNLFDEPAPFVNSPSGTAYDSDNFDVRGRFVSVSLNKKW